MEHLPGTPCWLDLQSPDPDAARAFYSALFGWEWTASGPEYGHYSQALVDGVPVAGLGPMPPADGARPAWTLYFHAPDADARADAIAQGGGAVVMPPMDVGDFGRMAVVTDSGGAVFGLWQPKTHRGFQRMGAHGTPCWFEVNVPNGDAAVSFYANQFGTEPQQMDGMPSPYFTMHAGGQPRFGILEMNEQWAGVPPHWMPYFAVDDTDAAIARVEAAGGVVCIQPFDTPFGRLAICNDPAGAVFTIIKPGSR